MIIALQSLSLYWEGVGERASIATAAVASSEISARNQMAGGKTSLVTRSPQGSNRGNESPTVHVDNQAPGRDYRRSGVRKESRVLE